MKKAISQGSKVRYTMLEKKVAFFEQGGRVAKRQL